MAPKKLFALSYLEIVWPPYAQTATKWQLEVKSLKNGGPGNLAKRQEITTFRLSLIEGTRSQLSNQASWLQ